VAIATEAGAMTVIAAEAREGMLPTFVSLAITKLPDFVTIEEAVFPVPVIT
jgi:hypothetical protein